MDLPQDKLPTAIALVFFVGVSVRGGPDSGTEKRSFSRSLLLTSFFSSNIQNFVLT